MDVQDKMKEKIENLRRTIQYLCTTMENAEAQIDKDPAMAKLMLSEARSDRRHVFR